MKNLLKTETVQFIIGFVGMALVAVALAVIIDAVSVVPPQP